MNVVIIKYNAGNTKSVENALLRVGIQPVITDDIAQIQQADKVIFPGVGHAQPTMQYLNERNLNKRMDHHESVVNGTIVFASEPFHCVILGNSVLGSNSGFASSSETNSASWSFKDNVKVHTENTGEWIILNTQINVFLDTETEISSI